MLHVSELEEEDLGAWDLLDDTINPSSPSLEVQDLDVSDASWTVLKKPRLKKQRYVSGKDTGSVKLTKGKAGKARDVELQYVEDRSSAKNPYGREHDASCQLCQETIRGDRWICKECPAWNVCQTCVTLVLCDNDVHPDHTLIRVMQPDDVVRLVPTNIVRASKLYMPSSEPDLHPGEVCSVCTGSIIGIRYECAVRECRRQGIVFCQDCEAKPINAHPSSHPLIKFKKPVADSEEVNAHVYLKANTNDLRTGSNLPLHPLFR